MAPLTLQLSQMSCVLTLCLLACSTPLRAETDLAEELQRARVEKLRRVHANQVHLMASDLIDELVLAYQSAPPFTHPTLVIMADVNGPLGFGSGFESILENHFSELLIEHPKTGLRLVHCPSCQSLTTHSDAKATIIAKGVDQPAMLKKLGVETGALHALYLDVEAEGQSLVLRARIVALEPGLPVVHAKTISSDFLSPALLRSGEYLVTAAQARQDYLSALSKQGPLQIPVRLSVTNFASVDDGSSILVPPIVWIGAGGEFSLNHTRDWMGSILAGGTWIPSLYNGYFLQGRVSRLLTGSAASLTHPNLYLSFGASLIGLQGPVTLTLQPNQPNLSVVQQLLNSSTPLFFYPSFQVGLDLRVGNRMGIALMGETTPTLGDVTSIGRYIDFGLLQVHALSAEVSICF